MDESILIKLNLYSGGFGVIQTRVERIHCNIIKVEKDIKSVSIIKYELVFDYENFSLKETSLAFATKVTECKIPFDDIISFEGYELNFISEKNSSQKK